MPRFKSLHKLLLCFDPCKGMPKRTSITISQISTEKGGTNVENKNLKDSSQATVRSPMKEQRTTFEKEGLKDCSDDMTESLLPLDVILEILKRLHVKPLSRCKCVCKLWRSAIEDRKFIEKHMRHNGLSHIFEEDTSGDAGEVKTYWSLDGLVLEGSTTSHNKLFLRNPATGQKVKLPDPDKGVMHIRFVYIRTSNSYKLVYLHAKVGEENGGCQVLTLGTDPTWRSIDIPSLHCLGTPGELLHSIINDEVFFLTRFTTTDSGVPELIYLDLASETFGHIKAPPVIFKNREKVSPVHWENKFALAYHVDEEMHFWVLEDYKKQKWAKKNIAFPSNFLEKYPDLVNTSLPPHSVNNGVLYFYLHKGYDIKYYIASRKAFVTALPPGNKICSLTYTSIFRIPEINLGRK